MIIHPFHPLLPLWKSSIPFIHFATLNGKTTTRSQECWPSRRRAAKCSCESGWKGWMMIIELAIVISRWTELVWYLPGITGSSTIVKTEYARQLRCIFLSLVAFLSSRSLLSACVLGDPAKIVLRTSTRILAFWEGEIEVEPALSWRWVPCFPLLP